MPITFKGKVKMSKKLCSEDLQSTFIRFEALEAPPTNVTGDVNLIFDWAKQLKEAHMLTRV